VAAPKASLLPLLGEPDHSVSVVAPRSPGVSSLVATSPSPTRRSLYPSPGASPAAASEDSDISADAFQERLMKLHFDAMMEINSSPDVDGVDVVAPSTSVDPGSALPASSTELTSGLFDGDSDAGGLVGGQEVQRLKRGHPYALPDAPAKRPGNNRQNHYDPTASWDYSVCCNINQLHDVRVRLRTAASSPNGTSNLCS